MDFKALTRKIWDSYFFGDHEGEYISKDSYAPECVVIGTGKHEIYRAMDQFLQEFQIEIEERDHVRFQFRDFWCEESKITEDVVLSYGEIVIMWTTEDKSRQMEMESRFSFLFRREEENQWRLVHVHQSVPNLEQLDGEYYPKSMTAQIQREKERTDSFAWLAQRDGLTGLLNYRTFEEAFEEEKRHGEWLFILDLDNFKMINDTYGHMKGNEVLKHIAQVLSSSIRSRDILCRMGGDEFIFLCGGIQNERDAGELMNRIVKNVQSVGDAEKVWCKASIGGTAIELGDSLKDAFNRADQALYEVKETGKGNWRIR